MVEFLALFKSHLKMYASKICKEQERCAISARQERASWLTLTDDDVCGAGESDSRLNGLCTTATRGYKVNKCALLLCIKKMEQFPE